ncbi:hypothetical protein [Bacillus wiedmannii]|uniref:hypothetical protein n=1 Tax=Bacillus wiedmannii TaxID=1890302 RepID=UPI000BED6CFC|nr:hypothetical protein [Bacillus wiedmannii]PEF38680.1 hypothetical protein CON72_11855 [Bacillus wiedmannii]
MRLNGLNKQDIYGINQYLNFLSYDDNKQLNIYNIPIEKMIETSESPTLIYLEERIKDNYLSIKTAFQSYFKKVEIYFALKCCYIPQCVNTLKNLGCGIEVMSDIELQIALQNGFSPKDIITNGLGRSQQYLEKNIDLPAKLTIIDNYEDLLNLQKLSQEKNIKVDIGLRVIPPINIDDDDIMIKPSSKLGMDWEDNIFLSVLKEAMSMPEFNVKGILFHQFSHVKSINLYNKFIEAVYEVIMSIYNELECKFEFIDLGGGFETRFLLEMENNTINDFAKRAFEQLTKIPYEYTLVLEPGRYIMADAAIAITNIIAEKKNLSTTWRIADIGSNILIPLPNIAYHPIPLQLPSSLCDWGIYNVGDATCAPSLICPHVHLPIGKEGRSLLLLNCGAYTTVFSELWVFFLPEILFLDHTKTIQTLFTKEKYTELMDLAYQYQIK